MGASTLIPSPRAPREAPLARALRVAGRERDVHRRHAARRDGLAAAGDGPGDAKAPARRILEVASCAIPLLDEEPREPVFPNLAGAALFELGRQAAAEALVAAAAG